MQVSYQGRLRLQGAAVTTSLCRYRVQRRGGAGYGVNPPVQMG